MSRPADSNQPSLSGFLSQSGWPESASSPTPIPPNQYLHALVPTSPLQPGYLLLRLGKLRHWPSLHLCPRTVGVVETCDFMSCSTRKPADLTSARCARPGAHLGFVPDSLFHSSWDCAAGAHFLRPFPRQSADDLLSSLTRKTKDIYINSTSTFLSWDSHFPPVCFHFLPSFPDIDVGTKCNPFLSVILSPFLQSPIRLYIINHLLASCVPYGSFYSALMTPLSSNKNLTPTLLSHNSYHLILFSPPQTS